MKKRMVMILIGFGIIILGCQGNQPPVINSVEVNPDTVIIGDTAIFVMNATDPESEALNYSWISIDEGGRTYLGDTLRWQPLSEGTYRFFARVEDKWGLSDTSETLTVLAVSGSIQILSVEGQGNSVDIVWSKYTGIAFYQYTVYMSTSPNFSIDQGNQVYVSSNLLDTTCTVTGLSSGTYYFKVLVTITSGSSISSPEYKFDMNAVTPVTLREPFNIRSNSVDLSWTPSEDDDFSFYEIHVSKTSNFTPSSATLVGTNTGRNDTLDTVTGLEPGVKYYFRVVVVDVDNNRGVSNEVSATTLDYKEVGKCDLRNGHSMDMVMIGNYMYVAAKEAGLVSISVSDPTSPSALGGFQTGYYECNDVYGDMTYLYVAMEDSIFILDHSANPANPQVIGRATVKSATRQDAVALSVFKLGQYLYVGVQNNNVNYLLVFDITTPATPTPVAGGELQIPGKPNDIFVDGNYAYIAAGTGGLVMVDISNPASMSIVSQLALNDEAEAVYIFGSYAYVAAGSEGLIVFDVSSPTSISRVAQWKESDSDARDVYAHAGKAYLADGINLTRVFDVTDPANPILEREVNTGKNNAAIWAKISTTGKFIYIGDWDNLFTVVEWE